MARPRVFISSTFYDLKDLRNALKSRLIDLGLDPLNFEDINFGVTPGRHAHDAALDQVHNCDYFILIIGGKAGTNYRGSKKKVTNKEYVTALKSHKVTFVYTRKDVWNAYEMYKSAPQNDYSSVVDDNSVFDFIDSVNNQLENNWIKTFENVEDILKGVTSQFAYILYLYAKRYSEEKNPNAKKKAEVEKHTKPFPKTFAQLNSVESEEKACYIDGFQKVHELICSIQNSEAKGKRNKLKQVWVIAKHGYISGDHIRVKANTFKQFAWSTHQGKRIADELETFDILCFYDQDFEYAEETTPYLNLSFRNDRGGNAVSALVKYVKDLNDKFQDETIAFSIFEEADFSIYT